MSHRTDTPGTTPRWAEGLALGCAGVLCFSGTAAATRVAGPVFGSVTLTCARIVIAAVLGIVTLALLKRPRFPGRQYLPGLLAAGLGQAVGYPLFLALALQRVPAYHGAVVIGLVPAATAVLSAIRTGERPTPRFWLACLLGFAVVLGFALVQGGGSVQLADGWLLAAVLSTAVGYVEGATVARRIGGTRTLCWSMLLLVPVAAALLVILGVPAGPASAWVGLVYAGVASMFVGSVLWFRALAAGGTARIGQLNLAQPFLAIIWSALLLGEHLTWLVPVSAALVLGCMAVCLNSRPAGGSPSG